MRVPIYFIREFFLQSCSKSSSIMEDLEVNDLLPINELPDIPLRRIFSFLPVFDRLEVEKVCQRWRIIGQAGWPDIEELRISSHVSYDLLLLILERCGRFLKKLTLSNAQRFSKVLSMIIQHCEFNQMESIHIELSEYFVDSDVELVTCQLRKILRGATKLVDMSYYEDVGLYGTDWLNSANPRTLQRLSIRSFSFVLPSFNPDQFPNLKKLFLYHIEIVGSEMRREKQSLKELEVLKIKNCDISQDFVQRIGTFENLRQLELRNIGYNMSNEHIRNIALHCCKLEEMDITCSPNMTSECFKYLGTSPLLRSLILRNFNNVNSRNIAYLKNVDYLRFGNCSGDLTG